MKKIAGYGILKWDKSFFIVCIHEWGPLLAGPLLMNQKSTCEKVFTFTDEISMSTEWKHVEVRAFFLVRPTAISEPNGYNIS